MRKTLCLLYSPLRTIIIIIVSPIVTVGYWLLSTVAIPLYIFRRILTFTARLCDPDLCQLVNTVGSITSRDYDSWNKSVCHAITVLISVNGSPSIEEIRHLFLQKVVYKKDVNYDKLEYPELQQMFFKRLGYLFFKWDRKFDICNHINIFSDKKLLPNGNSDIVNDATLMKIWETVSTKPLPYNQSPWDVHVIPNYFPNKTVQKLGSEIKPNDMQTAVILRVHHGLSDGFAIYKLLLTLIDDGLAYFEKEKLFRKAPVCMDLFVHLRAFFCGPLSMMKKVSAGFDIYNPLHRPLREKTGRAHIVTATIDLEIIKKIRHVHLDVSFHSVLMAALTGGMKNYLIANGHNIPILPIRIGLPIQKPGHKFNLRNDFFCTFVDLPIHKKTPRQRLLTMEKRLNQLTSEGFLHFMAQTWNIIGLAPLNVAKFLTLKAAVSLLYSEIKGPSKDFTVFNGKHKLMDLKYCFGLGTDDLGLAFTSLSYNGRVNMVLTLDHAVAATRNKAQQFMNLIMKELDELQYGDSTNL